MKWSWTELSAPEVAFWKLIAALVGAVFLVVQVVALIVVVIYGLRFGIWLAGVLP